MANIADDLEAILGARRELVEVVAEKDREIANLRESLKEAQGWWIRLEQKCKVLEGDSKGVLDAWDEDFLFQTRSNINFGRRSDGTRRVSIRPKVGVKTIVRCAQVKDGESLLRAAMNKANGRTRSAKK